MPLKEMVCPEFAPPVPRMMISDLSASRSVTIPLASSPHCRPVTAIVFTSGGMFEIFMISPFARVLPLVVWCTLKRYEAVRMGFYHPGIRNSVKVRFLLQMGDSPCPNISHTTPETTNESVNNAREVALEKHLAFH